MDRHLDWILTFKLHIMRNSSEHTESLGNGGDQYEMTDLERVDKIAQELFDKHIAPVLKEENVTEEFVRVYLDSLSSDLLIKIESDELVKDIKMRKAKKIELKNQLVNKLIEKINDVKLRQGSVKRFLTESVSVVLSCRAFIR